MKKIFLYSLKTLFIVALLIKPTLGYSQSTFAIEAILLDASTQATIPYANIYNASQKKGTTSNLQGYFKLNGLKQDTILISFIGYQTLKGQYSNLIGKDTIWLQPSVQQLNEVIVLAEDRWLYEILKKCRKTGTYTTEIAKTYFELETFVNQQQVELVEAYYNGKFKGYDVAELAFKNGRIAHTDNNKFVSLETSKALLMHQQFETNYYFPTGPLELSHKKLKKAFSLQLESQYKDENEHRILVIRYAPKKEDKGHFSGKIWVDAQTHDILRITSEIKEAKTHPFLPIIPTDTLSRVRLELEKTFQKRNNKRFIDHINFKTAFHYKRQNGDTLNVESQAVLYAYDYEEPFILPYFEFPKNARYVDYVNITVAPHNEVFWKINQPFKLNKADNSIEDFYKTHTPFYGSFFEIDSNNCHHFENPFLSWNKKRIVLREEIPQKRDNNNSNTKVISSSIKNVPTDYYHLEVQLYLDINERNDSLFTYTQTIIDPFQTFYEYPMDEGAVILINLYFDLVEIQRRDLERQLKERLYTKEEIEMLYKTTLQDLKIQSRTFFQEMVRGKNKDAVIKWNAYVRSKLDIDNIKYLGFDNQ